MVCEKSSRGKISACLEANGFENKMWECHAAKKMYAKSLLSEAATALQLEKKSWLEESPMREELVVLWESDRLHLTCTVVRQAVKVGEYSDWSELLKIQECCLEVRQRKSIVQQIRQKSTELSRADQRASWRCFGR